MDHKQKQIGLVSKLGLAFSGLLCLATTAHAGNQQCVYNQAGYVAEVKWFKPGAITSTKVSDANYKISAKESAFHTKKSLTLGFRDCVDGKGNTAVVTIKGGKIARVAAIVATDIGAAGATAGCFVGAAALTAVTAGAGSVALVGCEVVTDVAVGVIAEPSIIPDSKELFAVLVPPSTGKKGKEAILYGTVFNPKTRIGRP